MMINKKIIKFYTIFLLTFIAIISDVLINSFYLQRYRSIQREKASLELMHCRTKIEEILTKNLYIIYGMSSYITINQNISKPQFDKLAGLLLSRSNFLKNIAVAPDFRIKYIFPLKCNTKALGLNYRKHKDQWKKAEEAMLKKKMIIAGPIKLVQGGTGLAARVPVFTQKGKKFWGLVSSIIDFDRLLIESGINTNDSTLLISIKSIENSGNSKIIRGSEKIFQKESSIRMNVMMPNDIWLLAAEPKGGWIKKSPSRWLIHILIFMIYLMSILIWKQNEKRKNSLIDNEKKLNAMSRSSHDALIMINSDDEILFWNNAAEKLFGYKENEITGMKMHELITLPSNLEKVQRGLNQFRYTGEGPIINSLREVEAVKKSRATFPAELSVASFSVDGKWYAVGSIRDISSRKEYEEKLNLLATTDSLTGILNRRRFLELSDKEYKRSKRYNHSLSFIMFDLDHFKGINDTHGHDAGDEVLKEVSRTVSEHLRQTDIFARVGGEEFAILMPETSGDMAVTIAERIRSSLEITVIEKYPEIILTASFGVSELQNEESISVLIKRGDRALYEAKDGGRNKVVYIIS